MLVSGTWSVCEDGIVRPLCRALVLAAGGAWEPVEFLIDTGADRTTFVAGDAAALGLTAVGSRDQLTGLGGPMPAVQVQTSLRLRADDGQFLRFVSQFMALTDPAALDMSVLGRDILDHFALIVDRRRDRVLMLQDGHDDVIEGA